ncbi:MAG: sodium-dependent bicarbonate transport family permease [Gemmobacter sp.]|nr:sodium-dependent bicarbonate transport family permease [Gemmobacter sp.]
MVAGVALSFVLPFVAFALLGALTAMGATDAAAVAAHYGSISIVTFVTGTSRCWKGRGSPRTVIWWPSPPRWRRRRS